DSLVSAYYAAHQSEFMTEDQVHMRHIQVADEKTARDVLAQAKKGGDWDALAKKYSTDVATKEKGGDLGNVGKSGFFGGLGRQQALADSAWAAPLNTPEGPLKTGLGWHVYEVTEKVPPHARPLEEIKGVIARQLTQQANQDFYQASLAAEKQELHLSV